MKANGLQKLRDKLEQARDISVISDSCRDCYMIDTKNELINQALASLQADPCKRCGGSKQVWKCDKIGKAHPVGDDCIKIPCPDCNCKKIELMGAEPGDFTMPCPDPEGCKHFKNEQKSQALIDRQQAELAAKDEEIALAIGGCEAFQIWASEEAKGDFQAIIDTLKGKGGK